MTTSRSLQGVRIWLSGAVPEASSAGQSERETIASFVKLFAADVFKRGGHIVHGSHPTFTPILLQAAKDHQSNGGKRDCLTLVVSRYWSKNPSDVAIDSWRETCATYETPEASGSNARDDSLKILREWISARCDAFLAVGGKWWEQIAGRSGVPIEASLAIERGVPCFLAGGLGGAAADYLTRHPELLHSLKNGLDLETNRKIATTSDIAELAGIITEQFSRLPLVRGRTMDGPSFRILALDGGGIKGTFTASALATWEHQFGTPMLGHFDLIAGTSTGGILAIGLGMGLSASEMLSFYKNRGTTIFPTTSMSKNMWHNVRHVFAPKYSQRILLNEINKAYTRTDKAPTMGDSRCRLVIPAYHAIAGKTHVFRTPHHELLTSDAEIPASHVALATAAAPSYFSAAKVGNMIAESSYFDGGVWANSPAMAAIIEAVCYLGVSLDRIDVLSVGTTEEPYTLRKKTDGGLAKWNRDLVSVFMNAQSESSLTHARLLTGEPRFLRVNSMTRHGTYKLDDPREIEELASLGNTEALRPEILGQIRSRFLNGVPVEKWESFKKSSATQLALDKG